MEIKLNWKTYSLLVILLITITFVWYTTTPGKYDDFAKCLKEKEAIIYGAEWCGNCQDQKVMFGKSFKYIDYVECPKNPELCKEMNIEGYPTWIINGRPYLGLQELQTLSSLTNCPL